MDKSLSLYYYTFNILIIIIYINKERKEGFFGGGWRYEGHTNKTVIRHLSWQVTCQLLLPLAVVQSCQLFIFLPPKRGFGTLFAVEKNKKFFCVIMIPKTIVEHDESGLEMVLNFLDDLLTDRFIEGIRSKHRSIYEIEQTLEMVCIYQRRVNIESRSIARFAESFIRHYATDNNTCFNTAEVLFKKIQSTLKGLKEVFYKTTPIVRSQLPTGAEAPTVFDKSPLGGGDYTLDAFGLESFPKPVQDLYHAIDTLFSSSSAALALCHLMLEEEEKTRNDSVRLRQIYNESCEELLGAVKGFTAFMTGEKELPVNELEERRKNAKTEEEFLRENYHKYDYEIFTQYLVIKTIQEARREGLTEKEAFYFRKNREKAFRFREMMEHIDELPWAKGQKDSLSSRFIVEMLKWCELPESQEIRFYKDFFTPAYMGKKRRYKLLGWSAISGRRKEAKEMKITDEELADNFEKYLTQTLPRHEAAI